ncbi:MAG: hypothetical protein KDE27_03835 [Planctomycetes bacterium]|nr:hypothetical protein [Planctomycetota bacterium]
MDVPYCRDAVCPASDLAARLAGELSRARARLWTAEAELTSEDIHRCRRDLAVLEHIEAGIVARGVDHARRA